MDARLHQLQGKTERLTAVALGSNVGNRRAHLEYAIARLKTLLNGLRVSPFFETAFVGGGEAPQPDCLNGAVVGWSSTEPSLLLRELQAIERARGRTRPYPGAPRTLDLDLILVGNLILSLPELEVPHPRFRERRFVLEPLAAIGPDVVDPVTRQTVRELLATVDVDNQPLARRPSTAHSPGPRAARYRKMKQ